MVATSLVVHLNLNALRAALLRIFRILQRSGDRFVNVITDAVEHPFPAQCKRNTAARWQPGMRDAAAYLFPSSFAFNAICMERVESLLEGAAKIICFHCSLRMRRAFDLRSGID